MNRLSSAASALHPIFSVLKFSAVFVLRNALLSDAICVLLLYAGCLLALAPWCSIGHQEITLSYQIARKPVVGGHWVISQETIACPCCCAHWLPRSFIAFTHWLGGPTNKMVLCSSLNYLTGQTAGIFSLSSHDSFLQREDQDSGFNVHKLHLCSYQLKNNRNKRKTDNQTGNNLWRTFVSKSLL